MNKTNFIFYGTNIIVIFLNFPICELIRTESLRLIYELSQHIRSLPFFLFVTSTVLPIVPFVRSMSERLTRTASVNRKRVR